MRVHPVFRQIQRKDTYFGLELFDALLVLVLMGGFLMFTDNLFVIGAVTIVAYLGLYLLKKGKPAKHTYYLVRFLTRPKLLVPYSPESEVKKGRRG